MATLVITQQSQVSFSSWGGVPFSSWGGGPRPVQAGWATRENTAAKRERTTTLAYYQIVNTAARRERTARLGYYQLVSRDKRLIFD